MHIPTTYTDLGTLTGPVLLFGGVYSNLQALEALKVAAEQHGISPGNVICTGDTPGYCADPEACLDIVENWGIHAIAGNVETNLVNGTDDCGCGFGDGSRCDMFAKLWYTFAAANVSEKNLAYMANLPDMLRFEYAGKKVVVLHGSPENQSEFVWKSTPREIKQKYCEAVGADVVIGGHCGLPFTDTMNIADLSHAEPINNQLALITNHLSPLWLNPGVIGMPANDATPRTWYAILNDSEGLSVTFHQLHYDHAAAKSRMLDDRRLPVSYAATLSTGIWDNTEIMPPAEEAQQGIPLQTHQLNYNVTALRPTAAAVEQRNPGRSPKPPTPTKDMEQTYSNPKDLRSFGKIADWQEEMGEKFFAYYSGVTEGDTALTEREKALIALAVSHAIQCSYCIDAYTTNSLQAGADEEQMMEAVHVAAAVKAGTTLIYARQMQRQVEKITM